MNEIITRSLEENNAEFLGKFPRDLMNEDDITIVKWIINFKKKHEKTPSVKRVMKKFDHFIPFKFESSSWEPEAPAISDVFDQTVERRTLDITKRKMHEADTILERDGKIPLEIFEEIKKIQESCVGDSDAIKLAGPKDIPDEIPPREYIWEGIIETKSIVVIAGDGGNHKTNIFFGLGCHVAAGKRFANMGVKQCPVLYANLEMNEDWFMRKASQIIKGAGLEFDIPINWLTDFDFPLTEPKTRDKLIQAIKNTDAKLVIVDALMDTLGGRSDSDEEAVKLALKHIKQVVVETGASVIILHHFNRSKSYRGSSTIPQSIDLALKVEPKGEGDSGDIMHFTQGKQRGVKIDPFRIAIRFTPDEQHVVITRALVPEKVGSTELDRSPRVLEVIEGLGKIEDSGWVDFPKIKETLSIEFKVEPRTAGNLVNKMCKAGILEKDTTKKTHKIRLNGSRS